MADAPDWPKVLSLTVHEFRTPLTVVAGYLRMLSTDRVGTLTEAQRRVIDEAERSCARLSGLLAEVSEVAHFHQGRLTFMRSPVPLARVMQSLQLSAATEPHRLVVANGIGEVEIVGDGPRLGNAMSAVASAVARETMDSDTVHVLPAVRQAPNGHEAFIAIGSEALAHEILSAPPAQLSPFDSTRGGSGLSLVIARQIVEAHGGRLYGAPGARARAGAAIALPLSS
ncbi:MAG: histidine kinase dimerization/phospho-acceptor domain-containing protein [Vicinamibacterales bacterium]